MLANAHAEISNLLPFLPPCPFLLILHMYFSDEFFEKSNC